MYFARAFFLGVGLTASTVTLAADLPQPRQPLVSTFDWSGFYAGGFAGCAWGRTRVVDTGVVVERGAGTNGGVVGGIAGYNWQRDNFVFGLEGDFGFANLTGHGENLPPVIPPVAPPVVVLPRSYTVNWTADIRARAGYTFDPNTLVFVAGGVAFADFDFRDPNPPKLVVGATLSGWTIGAGVEHAFTNNFIARVEYLYTDYAKKRYNISPTDWYTAHLTTQTLRAAAVWKF